MRWSTKYWIVSLALAISLMAGCATPPAPYDYSALEKSRPRSILVIPPFNNSVEVNAPYIYLATISRPLAEKGYYVFPVAVIDQFLKENGLPSPSEMNNIPLDKIYEHIGADAVLYATIIDWGQKYQLLTSKTIVHSTLRLVDVRTGELLWQTTVRAVRSSDDGGAGLLGALVNAIVTQVAGSVSDNTAALSSFANKQFVNHPSVGLLQGPYFNPDSSIIWASGQRQGSWGDATELLTLGKAAGEIANATYDTKLWAEALVLADGDEQKRKGIYIKLRSEQLALEKEKADEAAADGSLQTIGNEATAVDITGTYVSDITSSSHWVFARPEQRRLRVSFTQNGDEITGINQPFDLKISATRAGDEISFYTWPSGIISSEIKGQWTINADGSKLTGSWRHPHGSGQWNLSRVGPANTARTNLPASSQVASSQNSGGGDISGTYTSTYTGKYLKRSPDFRIQNLQVRLVQDGEKITGTFGSQGKVWGDIIDAETIRFEIFATGGHSRSGTWTIDPVNHRLQGKMNSDESEEWNLTRIQ